MARQRLEALQKNKRRLRVRVKIKGSSDRPRLSVFRSHRNFFAQIIDDNEKKTILSLSTQDKEIKPKVARGGNVKAAEYLGELLAKKAKEKGVAKVAFDRSAYPYHGRIKAFAESARKGGLQF